MMLRLTAVALVVVLAACEQDRGSVEIRAAGAVSQEVQGGTFDGTSSNVVAIVIVSPQGVGICSGSLIAPNLVLTAHHCVADTNTTSCGSGGFGATYAPTAFRITTSGTAAETTLNMGQVPTVNNTTWFGAAAVTVPPTPANNICGGDMALIRLQTNINGICPLIPRVDSAVTANEAYTAVGFGLTSPNGQTSGTRYTVSGVSVLCESNCGPGTNGTMEWIGGSSLPRGVCEGDSGGPALDAQRRVIGTVSRGDATSCNQALYESVFAQAAWIKSTAAAAATSGGYPAAGWVTGGSTQINACTGADGGTGGGAGGGAGGGGGAPTGGGTGTGGGGGTGGCNAGTMCIDATGMGDFTCVSGTGGVPPNAPSCSQTVACAAGFSCWQTGTTSFACLQDCVGTPTGGGAGGGGAPPTGGGTGTGGGGGAGGACTNSATTCVNASGTGQYACVDVNSSNGIPVGAPGCSQTVACPANYGCWGTTSGNFCLQSCTPGATGGGAGGGGGPLGGGAGGGGPLGGGAGGGLPVGGGAGGGGPLGGGAGGGLPVGGGAGGGLPVGGGMGGGVGGGTPAGGGTGAGGAGNGGGFAFPGLPDKPQPTGCGCAGVPDASALWLVLSGLTLLRRRQRSLRR